jgi:phytoene dehydrogenase-like protein
MATDRAQSDLEGFRWDVEPSWCLFVEFRPVHRNAARDVYIYTYEYRQDVQDCLPYTSYSWPIRSPGRAAGVGISFTPLSLLGCLMR